MTGSGTSDSPYIITTIQDLVDITDVPYDMSAYYQLGADIDLTGDETFKGIASYDTPFEGHFDGKKHTISHWNGSIRGNAAGFFRATSGATISNIRLETCTLQVWSAWWGASGGGLLIGRCLNTEVSGCNAYGCTVTASYEVGGLIGQLAANDGKKHTISNCSFSDTVQGNSAVGGVIGNCIIINDSECEIFCVHSLGTVFGTVEGIGGVIGCAQRWSSMEV